MTTIMINIHMFPFSLNAYAICDKIDTLEYIEYKQFLEFKKNIQQLQLPERSEQKRPISKQQQQQEIQKEVEPATEQRKEQTQSMTTSITTTYATFYFRIGEDKTGCPLVQNFDGHFGSCGQAYNSDSKYWVAIANGNSYCGSNIRVKYSNTDTEMTLTVMDTCPGCTDGHIDMGLDALIELTGSIGAACAIDRELPKIEWSFI
jgi:hypothetical protein